MCKRRLFLLVGALEDEADSPALAEENTTDEALPHVSLHAIAGLRRNDKMQIHLQVRGVPLVALIDSGSTHNFITDEVAKRPGLPLQHCTGMTATVANGERIACLGAIRRALFTVYNEPFAANLFVLPLADYDVVLCTQ